MAQKRSGERAESMERLWRERIEAWRGSGQTQREFCQTHKISASSLSRWKVQLARHDELPAELAMASPVAASRVARGSEALRWTEVRWPAAGTDVAPAAQEGSGFEVVLPR